MFYFKLCLTSEQGGGSPEYFSTVYHQFPTTKNKPNRKPRKSLYTGITTFTPSRNPKNQNFYYYNKKKSYYFDKQNNKQRVQPPPQSVTPTESASALSRRYHPVTGQCLDCDNFIFQSIWYWSLFDSPITESPNYYSTTGINSFVDSFDVSKHYHSLQQMQTSIIPPHYKSQPTASPLYQRILLEARDLQRSLNQYNDKESLPPTIFASYHNGELPVIIDTGASVSITLPCAELQDWLNHRLITNATISSLNSLASKC